jgi:tetratricopeptide (TPR) repeat protein
MRRSSRYVVAVALLGGLLLPSVAIACMWDYDTIKMERTRFPGTLELITGKFLRHSPEFYKWRIENRIKRLESDPTNPALLDDLAVAYDKTDQHDKAIATALKTDKLHPGRYETAANLGTFYFHSGKLTEGIPYIDAALKINPDAHFGREKYQKLLVEYVLQRRKGGPLKLPLADVGEFSAKVNENSSAKANEKSLTKANEDAPAKVNENTSAHHMTVEYTFANFLWPNHSFNLPPDEIAAAIKGILGMMKFGKHDSPVLLEALGTLLTRGLDDPKDDAKLLAARAYLKASYEVPEGPARTAYRALATKALYMQTSKLHNTSQLTVELLEPDFKKELEEGQAWYAELHERELSWIRDGQNPEEEFDKLYDAEPEVSGMDVQDPLTPDERVQLLIKAVIALAIICALGVGIVLHVHRKRRRVTPFTRNGHEQM